MASQRKFPIDRGACRKQRWEFAARRFGQRVMSIPIDLSRKVALITGASQGIGARVARTFHQAGAVVVINHPGNAGTAKDAASLSAELNAGRDGSAEVEAADVSSAVGQSKIVFYQYSAGHPGFNGGPIPCNGLANGFAYRTATSGAFTPGGTTNSCDGTSWYTRTAGNSAYLVLFNNGAGYANYWGGGMGGNNSWYHDGWWYVR